MNQFVSSVLDRRSSLMTLGALGVKVATTPIAADAKKKHGKTKRKQGDPNGRCTQQAETWNTFVTTECAGDATCLEFLTCAEPLKTCNFTGFFACFARLINF